MSINFNFNYGESPEDLLSLKELCLKHGFEYNYLYKIAITKGLIGVYYRGSWKLSESEVLKFFEDIAKTKLSKIRTSNGGA